MPTAMLGVRKGVLPNARIGAGESAAGVSSGTACVRSMPLRARHACHADQGTARSRRAKCMQTNAVKTMAARRFKKELKRGQTPQGMSLTKGLEAETATRPKIQPRLKHRGKDKP